MKALLLENIHPDAAELLTQAGYEVDARAGALSSSDLIQALDGVDLLGIRSGTHVSADVIQAAPQLQTVGCFCIGTNQVDLDAAARSGVAVFNAPYSNTRSVVELAMAEIVVLSRHLTDRNAEMHEGIWQKSASGSHEIRAHTIGLIGYGNIGSQLSVLAESFGMRVLYFDIADKLALGNAQRVDRLNDLLGAADFVSIHVDGRPENTAFFGEAQLAAMKDRSYLLNLSRGYVVDIPALARHLRSGHLAGAAVDVFPSEPRHAGDRFSIELQGIPNVILTPHVGGSTQEAQVDIGHYVAAKLLDYLRTGSTQMSVNIPNVQAPEQVGHRVSFIHRNVPGVLASLNAILASHHANIAFQALSTAGEIGYVVTDVTAAEPGVADQLAELPAAVRVRVL